MAPYDDRVHQQRASFLSALLSLLTMAFILCFFFLICGGLSLYILAVLAGVSLVGLVHYLLWGRAMNITTAGEREEEEVWARVEEGLWPPEDRFRQHP